MKLANFCLCDSYRWFTRCGKLPKKKPSLKHELSTPLNTVMLAWRWEEFGSWKTRRFLASGFYHGHQAAQLCPVLKFSSGDSHAVHNDYNDMQSGNEELCDLLSGVHKSTELLFLFSKKGSCTSKTWSTRKQVCHVFCLKCFLELLNIIPNWFFQKTKKVSFEEPGNYQKMVLKSKNGGKKTKGQKHFLEVNKILDEKFLSFFYWKVAQKFASCL